MPSFILLIVAIVAFLVSTRQWALWARSIVWLVGLVSLIAAVAFAAGLDGHYGVFRAIGDAFNHGGDLSQSVLAQSFERNKDTALRFVPPLIDVFLVFVAIMAVLALAAFTPGERMEELLRPFQFIMIGAILGGGAALYIVGIGFGGPIDQRTYVGVMDGTRIADDVHDADTFWVGEVSLRLWGVDAPELGQKCQSGAECGRHARENLARLLAGAIVNCETVERAATRGPTTSTATRESFGRPLVRCQVQPKDPKIERFDLADRMVEEGYAVAYRGPIEEAERASFARLQEAEAVAVALKVGLQTECWLDPRRYRAADGEKDRKAFDEGRLADIAAEHLIGTCDRNAGRRGRVNTAPRAAP